MRFDSIWGGIPEKDRPLALRLLGHLKDTGDRGELLSNFLPAINIWIRKGSSKTYVSMSHPYLAFKKIAEEGSLLALIGLQDILNTHCHDNPIADSVRNILKDSYSKLEVNPWAKEHPGLSLSTVAEELKKVIFWDESALEEVMKAGFSATEGCIYPGVTPASITWGEPRFSFSFNQASIVETIKASLNQFIISALTSIKNNPEERAGLLYEVDTILGYYPRPSAITESEDESSTAIYRGTKWLHNLKEQLEAAGSSDAAAGAGAARGLDLPIEPIEGAIEDLSHKGDGGGVEERKDGN